ncbi:MAG: LegC family aminotransferase [Erysipelotrichaceae bacterium]|nr:LegC family aminotransferase [Erysipelotrichaceae bacterium]
MSKFIPLCVPNFEGNEKKYVDDAVEQTWVSTGGAYITELEKRLAEFLKVDNVAACQSGTSALHLSLIEAGVMPWDAVIVPTLTFIAAVNPVKYQFAEPIFMDADDSLCMDPVKLRDFCVNECEFKDKKLTFRGKHVKAIVVVHVFGNLADMESIMSVAEEFNLKVVEDATEALGSKFIEGKYSGKYAGTIGDFGAYSFNGNKIITTGGGGAITSKDSKVVDHLRFLSTQAKKDPHYYIHDEIGYNYRMTNLQAALGVAQMEELPEFIKRKQDNYELYKELFEDCVFCSVFPFREGTESNKWFYSLEINRNIIKATMREIITKLEEKGIQTRPIWGLIHEQKPYKDAFAYKIEKAKYYSECILNVPSSTNISKTEMKKVVETISSFLKKAAKERNIIND